VTSPVADIKKSSGRPNRFSGVIARSGEIRILVVALILSAYFETVNHDFLLTSASLENLSQFIAPVAIIACGEIMLMIGGEIDLSAGMVFAFAPFIMHFASEAGLPVWVALLVGVAAAGVVGLINGAVTVYLRIRHAVLRQRLHADHFARHTGFSARRRRIRGVRWGVGL
jgi:simple sugar transport system permease protein